MNQNTLHNHNNNNGNNRIRYEKDKTIWYWAINDVYYFNAILLLWCYIRVLCLMWRQNREWGGCAKRLRALFIVIRICWWYWCDVVWSMWCMWVCGLDELTDSLSTNISGETTTKMENTFSQCQSIGHILVCWGACRSVKIRRINKSAIAAAHSLSADANCRALVVRRWTSSIYGGMYLCWRYLRSPPYISYTLRMFYKCSRTGWTDSSVPRWASSSFCGLGLASGT